MMKNSYKPMMVDGSWTIGTENEGCVVTNDRVFGQYVWDAEDDAQIAADLINDLDSVPGEIERHERFLLDNDRNAFYLADDGKYRLDLPSPLEPEEAEILWAFGLAELVDEDLIDWGE